MRRTLLALALVLGCGSSSTTPGGATGNDSGAAAGGAFGSVTPDGGGALAGSGGTGGTGTGGSAGGTGGGLVSSDAGGLSTADAAVTTDAASTSDGSATDAAYMGAMGDTAAPPPTPDSAITADTAALTPDASPPAVDTAPTPVDTAPSSPDAAAPTPDVASMPDSAPAMADAAAPPACTPGTTLGCPVGSFCSLATGTCLAETGGLHFTFTDSCQLAGAQADVKIFDETNGGGWPAAGIVYVIPYAMTKTIDINCIPGAKVCYGAADHNTGVIYWGVGLDNTQSCANCCTTCAPPGNVPPYNLLCQ